MLNTQKGGYTPLILCNDIAKDDTEFATFDTEEDARKGALSSTLGSEFGYEIFERGYGCS